MKLNYKRTLLCGFAFFLICTFWQAYDTVIPKILTDRFGLPQAWSGIVMALDNILALFMLPFFGSLSDKCHTKIGKRKPFILVGTIIAVAAFISLSFCDASQIGMIREVAVTNPSDSAYSAALGKIYDEVSDSEITSPDGEKFILSEKFTKETFSAVNPHILEARIDAGKEILLTFADGESKKINSEYKTHIVSPDGKTFYLRDRSTGDDRQINDIISVNGREISLAAADGGDDVLFSEVTNAVYTNYIVPARQLYIHRATVKSPANLIRFMLILLVVLVAMSSFRSPAVALMPDITPKPLRSKANAIINLMGTLGGICVLVLGMGFAFNNSAISNTFIPYTLFFSVIGGIMLAALLIFMLTVRENKWTAEAGNSDDGGDADEGTDSAGTKKKLSRSELVSLIFILASVALWYFGYNAVTSKYSVYATNVLDLDYSATLLIANAAAVVSYIPVGMISSKIGRKKSILAGVVMLAVAFGPACAMRVGSPAILMNLIFALAGIGWATINVNSFPMVVELSTGSNIGKYTGYYYAASMGAQAITPFFSGLLMDRFGMTVLFPYATVFVTLAFITMIFVRHGDSKPIPKKSLLEHLDTDND